MDEGELTGLAKILNEGFVKPVLALLAGGVFAVGWIAFMLDPSLPVAIFDGAAFIPVLRVYNHYFPSKTKKPVAS